MFQYAARSGVALVRLLLAVQHLADILKLLLVDEVALL